MTLFSRFIRDRRGSTAVEFAVIAVALIVLFMIILDLGRAMWIKSTLQSVAEDTARCYALHKPQNDVATDTSLECRDNANAVTYAYESAKGRAVTLAVESDAKIYDGKVSGQASEAEGNCLPTGTTNANGKTMVYVVLEYAYEPILPFKFASYDIEGKGCYPIN